MPGVKSNDGGDYVVVGLSHLLEQTRSMSDIPVVESGYAAERREPGAPWSIASLTE